MFFFFFFPFFLEIFIRYLRTENMLCLWFFSPYWQAMAAFLNLSHIQGIAKFSYTTIGSSKYPLPVATG